MGLPQLPLRAAYIHLKNPTKARNVLSLSVLKDIRAQLAHHLTPPSTHKPLLLPSFKSHVLETLEADAKLSTKREKSNLESHSAFLVRGPSHKRLRGALPQVLVLRSEGDEFSAGLDLEEFAAASEEDRTETFGVLGHISGLIRHSPAIVVAAVQGPATGVGLQLAMLADVTIAMADTKFQLPGMKDLGLPDISALSVAHRVPPGLVYRMFATGEAVTAAEVGAGGELDVVPVPAVDSGKTREEVFEERVAGTVERLATETAAMAQAYGKWVFMTHKGIRSTEESSSWVAKAMVLGATRDNAVEGMRASLEGRTPVWTDGEQGLPVKGARTVEPEWNWKL